MMYENLIKSNVASFKAELIKYCGLLGINPDDLMVVMYAESRINEKARNPKTRATGLIQFMPATAIALGTTVDALYNMSNVEQLYYVYKYFKTYAGKIHNVYDLYKVVFFPAMIGKPGNWILQTSKYSAELIARQNEIIDMNHNGSITVAEFEAYVSTYLKKKLVR